MQIINSFYKYLKIQE